MTNSTDPFTLSAEDFAGISDKTSTWTAEDWRQMRELLSYRGRAQAAIKRFLGDLTTEQLRDTYVFVRDAHVEAHPNAHEEWKNEQARRADRKWRDEENKRTDAYR